MTVTAPPQHELTDVQRRRWLRRLDLTWDDPAAGCHPECAAAAAVFNVETLHYVTNPDLPKHCEQDNCGCRGCLWREYRDTRVFLEQIIADEVRWPDVDDEYAVFGDAAQDQLQYDIEMQLRGLEAALLYGPGGRRR